jgi:hypothetical protein
MLETSKLNPPVSRICAVYFSIFKQIYIGNNGCFTVFYNHCFWSQTIKPFTFDPEICAASGAYRNIRTVSHTDRRSALVKSRFSNGIMMYYNVS